MPLSTPKVIAGSFEFIQFQIDAAKLSAGGQFPLVSPVDGFVEEVGLIVSEAVVTGGTISVSSSTGAVAGATQAVPNSAAAGAIYTIVPTKGGANRAVAAGTVVNINIDAAFNGGGAINGYIKLRDKIDPQNVYPY